MADRIMTIVARGVWIFGAVVGCNTVANSPPPVAPEVSVSPASQVAEGMPAAMAALAQEDPLAALKIIQPLAEAGFADAQHALGFLYDLGLGVPYDPAAGVRWQTKAAEQKHYWAILYLGWKYRVGLGMEKADPKRGDELQAVLFQQKPTERVVPDSWLKVNGVNFRPDYGRAQRWLVAQSNRGDVAACEVLAEYALIGLGARANAQEHLRWLALAAERGKASALERLANYYAMGLFVAENATLAADYLEKAAAAGSAAAQYRLGENYRKGKGRPVDLTKAVAWYRRAADQQHLPAINQLADLLRKGGEGVPADHPEALRLSRQAAALGNAEAMTEVAGMLRRGEGVAKDVQEAFRLYQAAAEKGYAYAKLMTGWMLKYGELGEPDYAEAKRWFELAAQDKTETAMRELGSLYYEGKGVAKDMALAFLWFERAAREGDGWCQDAVGSMLASGLGVEKDEAEAVTWFELAAKQNVASAATNAGVCYHRGVGVSPDPTKAMAYYRQALSLGQGKVAALLAHAMMVRPMENSADFFQEVTEHLLAREGALTPEEQVSLARLLLFPKNPLADPAKGLAILEKHKQEQPVARLLLALEYLRGERALEGRRLMKAAAEENTQAAKYFLGLACMLGVGGPRDEAEGRRLLLEEAGTPPEVLAYIQYRGLGQAADLEAAVQQVRRVADKGSKHAQAALSKNESLAILEAFFQNQPSPKQIAQTPAMSTEGNQRPKIITTCSPVYPYLASCLGVTGSAMVEFIVDQQGQPRDFVVTGATLPDFADAAVQALIQWKFSPGRKNGRLINVRVAQKIDFTLDTALPAPQEIVLSPLF